MQKKKNFEISVFLNLLVHEFCLESRNKTVHDFNYSFFQVTSLLISFFIHKYIYEKLFSSYQYKNVFKKCKKKGKKKENSIKINQSTIMFLIALNLR